ncbi:MAG TPA: hypothetical protein VEH54_06555 [Steroidobacteraceae bacterium]|nr:hypothetical protein [Steroidobacteraceae bacterium]
MRLVIGVLACLSAFALSTAFADPPAPQPAATPAPTTGSALPAAANAPAAPATAQSSASPATAPATAAAKPAATTDNPGAKRLLAEGYRPETQNGRTVYCRKETTPGSRLPAKVCGNEDDLLRSATQGQQDLQKIQRSGASPQGN